MINLKYKKTSCVHQGLQYLQATIKLQLKSKKEILLLLVNNFPSKTLNNWFINTHLQLTHHNYGLCK